MYDLLNSSIQLFVKIFSIPVITYFDYLSHFKRRSVRQGFQGFGIAGELLSGILLHPAPCACDPFTETPDYCFPVGPDAQHKVRHRQGG